MDDQYSPEAINKIVEEALGKRAILPLSFIETSLFERLSYLLSQYMNHADATYVVSELREHFLAGFTSFTPKKLHDIVHHCIKCPNLERPPVTPAWNCADPDLMIVVENPTSFEPYKDILVSGLKEAGFSSARCMLTYLTRCRVYKPDDSIVSNCLPYIHTEIAAVKPKLILTLGLSSYVAITGDSSSKLSDLRGSIRWAGPYALLPEASLAWGAHAKSQGDTSTSYLSSSLATAYGFLYGD